MINLGSDFDRAILTTAGIDPDAIQAGTVTIDFIPNSGPTTIRYTAVATIDSDTLRALIRDAAPAPTPTPTQDDPGVGTTDPGVSTLG
ncbi:hypothetical protein [Frondihabitans sp. VKM Ac-2883]|uniref:hypothetical protein n=1 Tax=Frondihabitans sp. VKM Ac-2883 TaxID=2783823 RepID=UPI00188D80BC|nr:hypothetical protein [Frondihabitans sp. VKM Ac-2883]MBF4574687.1 hypothetical protein [Frondihabitans sp. VKM Ac-2883]